MPNFLASPTVASIIFLLLGSATRTCSAFAPTAYSAGSRTTNCTATSPCVFANHDCAGNDLFDVGRTKAYTMDQCAALCKATKSCTGFVFDAIPAESHE
eukprot:SAG31_NODE_15793_length_738_cov_1.805947_1_plen_99_part_00